MSHDQDTPSPALALATPPAAQHQHPASHDRANQGMGFDQQKTTHHFLLQKTGGTIEVTAKDAADQVSTDQIRVHLRHIASAFADGDFSLPIFVHDTDPQNCRASPDEGAPRGDDVSIRGDRAGGKVVINTQRRRHGGARRAATTSCASRFASTRPATR